LKIEIDLDHYLAAHSASIYAIERASDTLFFTGGEDGNLLEWDLANTTQARAIAKTQASIYVIKCIDRHLLFVGTNNGETYLINSSQKKVVSEQNFHRTVFDFSLQPDGRTALIALADGYMATVALPSLKIIRNVPIANGHIRTIQPHPNRTSFALGSSDGSIYFVSEQLKVQQVIEKAHNDSVFALHYVSAKNLISGGKDALLKHWQTNDGDFKEVTSVPAHMFAINQIIAGPGTGQFTTASRDKSIKIWDSQTLLLQKVIDRGKIARASSHSVNRLVYLSSGVLAAVGDDRVVRVYSVRQKPPLNPMLN